MSEAPAEMPNRQQSYAAMVVRMAYLSPPLDRWTDLLAGVVEVADPLIADDAGQFSHWDLKQLKWVAR